MATDGMVYEGGSFGPYYTFGDGNIFIGCTFHAPVYFGKGNVFINCSWLRCCYPYYSNPYSQVRDGGVVDGGWWDYVTFSPNVTLKSGGGGSYTMGMGTTLDAASRKAGGGTGQYQAFGQIVTGEDYKELAGNWDSKVLSEGYEILGDAEGVEIDTPDDTIACG